jgi:toxin ParE1/3/4
MNLRYTERASDDINLAMEWYERQSQGLGIGFLDCIEQAIIRIIRNPQSYQIYYANFRGCTISRFPFTVFYTIELDEIVVHSVFASRQDPAQRPQE